MIISLRLFPFLAGLLILTSCHSREGADRIVGSLGSETITVSDLQNSATFIGISDLAEGHPSLWSAAIRKAVLAETIDDRLLLDFVKGRHITLPPEVKEKVTGGPATRGLESKRLLIQEAIKRIAPKQMVDDKEVERYYQNHQDLFSIPVEALVRHIVTSDKNEGIAIEKALDNGSSFSALARAKSLGVEASKGGLMAPFARGQMPPPFDTVFDLSPGEVSDLLPSPYGYHVFELVKLIPKNVRPLSQVEEHIRKILLTQKRRKLLEDWIKEQEQKTPWKPSHHYRRIFPGDLE